MMSTPVPLSSPEDVFYVVQSTGPLGRRAHCVSSVLFETRLHANAKLGRLRAENPGREYDIWSSTTYVEPPTWSYPVMLANGTIVLPDDSQSAEVGL
jgi:hypothetical protein